MAVTIQGTAPAMHPKMNGSMSPSPGVVYRPCSQPNRIMHTFAVKMPISAM